MVAPKTPRALPEKLPVPCCEVGLGTGRVAVRDAATGRPHWIATRNVSLDASRRICATLPVVDRDGRFVRVRLPDGAEIWVRMIEDRVKYTGEPN